MTITERLSKARKFLEASDDLTARELVDSVLTEDPKNAEALHLDDVIVRRRVEAAHLHLYADQTDLGFVLPERGRSILIGIALAVLGILTLFYVGNQMRTGANRPAALTASG